MIVYNIYVEYMIYIYIYGNSINSVIVIKIYHKLFG